MCLPIIKSGWLARCSSLPFDKASFAYTAIFQRCVTLQVEFISAPSNVIAVLMIQQLFELKEKLRIKHHLLGAKLQYDRNTEAIDLDLHQYAIRQTTSQRLSDYIQRGEFPKNTEKKEYVPAIRDKYGTLCAMAYLIDETGEHELVDELDQEGRYKYIEEFQSLQLPVWLYSNHMKAEEAARIQPMYGPPSNQAYFIINPLILVIALAQILIFGTGIALYWVKFRSSDRQLYVDNLSNSWPAILNVLGIFFLLLSYIFPIFTDYSHSGINGDLSLYLLSPQLSSIIFPSLLLIISLVYYVFGMQGRYFHPVFTILLLVSTAVYLFSIIYYQLFAGLYTVSGNIAGVKSPGTNIGYNFYSLHFIVLIIISVVSIRNYNKNLSV